MLGVDLPTLLVLLPAVVIATTFHEYAHALIADRLGANQRYEQPRPMLFYVALTIVGAEVLALLWFLVRRSPASRRAAVFTLLVQGGFYIAVFLAQATVWWR